jgi:hypothetical protein
LKSRAKLRRYAKLKSSAKLRRHAKLQRNATPSSNARQRSNAKLKRSDNRSWTANLRNKIGGMRPIIGALCNSSGHIGLDGSLKCLSYIKSFVCLKRS